MLDSWRFRTCAYEKERVYNLQLTGCCWARFVLGATSITNLNSPHTHNFRSIPFSALSRCQGLWWLENRQPSHAWSLATKFDVFQLQLWLVLAYHLTPFAYLFTKHYSFDSQCHSHNIIFSGKSMCTCEATPLTQGVVSICTRSNRVCLLSILSRWLLST